jgi:hypothetical protein
VPATLEPPDEGDELNIYSRNGDYFNNYEEVNDIPESDIMSPPFNEVIMDAEAWILPAPYVCIIRAWNPRRKRIKEYSFKRLSSAHKKITDLITGGNEVTIMTPEVMGVIDQGDKPTGEMTNADS